MGMATTLAKHLVESGWAKHIGEEFKKPYFEKLGKHLDAEFSAKKQVFPPLDDVFSAFNMCPFDKVRVVILGQDPYHDDNQAHGLSFSVRKGIKIPPSLRNMYKELQTDISNFKAPDHGNLESWAHQGVLMLNACLTVRAHEAFSHSKFGWEKFTDAAIKSLNDNKEGVVFLLWGKPAQKKGKIVNRSKHHVLECAHPSPLSASRGFFGCKHFSKTNEYLAKAGQPPIDWVLDGSAKELPASFSNAASPKKGTLLAFFNKSTPSPNSKKRKSTGEESDTKKQK